MEESNIKTKSKNLKITKVQFSLSNDDKEKKIIGMENNKSLEEQLLNGKNQSKIENDKLKNISPKYINYLNMIKETLQSIVKLFSNLILNVAILEKNNICNASYTLINKEPGKNSINENDYDILGKNYNELKGFNNIINEIQKNNLCAQDKSMNSTAENSSIIQSKEHSLNESNLNNNNNITPLKANDSGINFNSSLDKAKGNQYIQNGITDNNSSELTAIHSKFFPDNNNSGVLEDSKQNINEELTKMIPEEYLDPQLSKFEEILYNHVGSCKFFFQLRDKNYLSAGDDIIIIYDQEFKQKKAKIPNFEDILFCVSEIKSKKKEYIELIVCCLKNIYLVSINKKNNFKHTYKKYEIPKCKTLFCYNIRDNYILAGKDFSMVIENLFNDNLAEKKMYKLLELSFKTGIKIDNENIALISNALLPGGKNQICIFNIVEHKLIHTIENISPTLTENCACIAKLNDKSYILLCGCKKILNNEGNGIFMANLNLETMLNVSINITRLSATDKIDQEEIDNKFYSTKNFQVYCLCQINLNQENGASPKYFLSGGFDTDKKIGVIKLYQLNVESLDIKYLQDLELEEYYDCLEDENTSIKTNIKPEENENKGLNMPINNITQCEKSGKIVVTSMNGGVYLFSKPNLNFYIDRIK
jgi:hypothetical protein